MRVIVQAVGKLKDPHIAALSADYEKRLRAYCKLEVGEYKTDAAMLAALPDRSCLVALDERGKTLSSEELAHGVVGHHQLHGGGRPLVFAIGGADGHSSELRQRADHLLCFGRLTIAHRLVRVLVLEQVYRAFTILAGEPYHRA